jgi:hypothetical protein
MQYFNRYGLLLLMMILTGCALYDRTQDPKIWSPIATVTSVRLVEQTDQGAVLKITIGLVNPNAVALPLKGTSYTLAVGGATNSYHDLPNSTLPAGGDQTVELTAALPATTNLSGAAVKVHGSVTYVPPGEIRRLLTESKVPLPSASFNYTGAVQ